MHEPYTIDPGSAYDMQCPPLNVYTEDPLASTLPRPSLGIPPEEIPPISQSSAPPEWLGTPMEMMADAFGMDSPWRHGQKNWDMHKRKTQERRNRRNKAAKKARRRNRR